MKQMLYGREVERQHLMSLVDAVRQGRSAMVLVTGEPGAGKSSLLEDVRTAAADMLLLDARGVEAEAELPFAALHQLLRPVLNRIDHLSEARSTALRGALGLGTGGTTDAYGVALAVLDLLAEVASDTPVLCLMDDVQWMDHTSAQVLLFTARRLHAEGVMMMFASRQSDILGAQVPTLSLAPLDAEAAAHVLMDNAGSSIAADVAQRLRDATGGNALAITELARLIPADQLAGREPLPVLLPMSSGVERLFADRISALPKNVRRLLLVAAADDTGSPNVVLTAAKLLGIDTLAVDVAEQAGLLWVDTDVVRFRHPLVRSAVYGTASLTDRQAVHRALASVLEPMLEEDRYAWHLAAASLTTDEGVAQHLDRAAGRARARNAFAASSVAFERAAELSPNSTDRGRRLTEAATDAWLTGLLPRAGRLIQKAEPLVEDPAVLGNCYRIRGSIELAAGTSVNTMSILIEAARRSADVDPRRALELLSLAGEGASLSLNKEVGAQIADIAASLDVGEDSHNQFLAELLSGFVHGSAGETEAAIQAIHHAIQVAQDEFEDVDLLLAAGRAGLYVGDDAAAVHFHERIVARARKIASVGCLAIAGTRLAFAELLTGEWASASALAEETGRLSEDTGQAELAAHALAWQALLAAWRGDEARCQSAIDRARSLAAAHPMAIVDDALGWIEGLRELGAGRPEQAFTHLRHLTHPVIAGAASLDRVEAAIHAKHDDEARKWVDEIARFAAASQAPWAKARLAHCRALLTKDLTATEALFAEALSHHNAAARPFERARTELAWGQSLRRHRQRVDARNHLREAAERFEALGATPWAERARVELRASGETLRQRDPVTLTHLTPQELQVAKLVSQGLSNREVAAQLFLSPRTVDFHLRGIFNKLGITSRTQLASRSLVR